MKKFRGTSVQSVPLRVGVKLEEFDEDEETESWPFRELVGGLMWLAILTPPIFPTQFDLLGGTVPHRKPSTGKRRLVIWHTPMILVVLALHTSEGLQWVFH